MKKTSTSTLSSLPQDIQVSIFLRLPVNSVLVCRCVCKLWHTQLCSPNFIKYHLNNTIQKNNNPKLMFLDDQRYDGNKEVFAAYSIDYASLSSYSLSMDQSFCECDGAVRMDYPFEYKECTNEYNRGNYIDILGSCNGLICMGILIELDYATNLYKDGSICVWNPSTREYKKIQVPEHHFGSYSKSTFNVRYGFGYDCIINDYKVVRMSGSGGVKIEVYPLRSSTWNCTETKSYKFPHERRSRGLLFNGALHWLGVAIIQETSSEVIISFDISNERIVDVRLPEESMLNLGNIKANKDLGMWKDCLCLVLNLPDTRTDIWVMQKFGVRESWTKQFTFSQQIVSKHSYPKPIWTLQNGEVLIECGYGLALFYPSNGIERQFRVGRGSFLDKTRVREPVICMESLVSLDTGTYVKRSWCQKRMR